MARLDMTYDVANLPDDDFDNSPIPEGWYQAQVDSVEVKETKKGTGEYLNIRWKILGPKYANQGVWDMVIFRYSGDSDKALKIGQAKMKKMLSALNVSKFNDTDQIMNRTAEIKVIIEESPGYDPKNVIKNFRAMEGSAIPQMPTSQPPRQAPPAQPGPQAKGSGTMPWDR
jgi:hypothetical protein